MPGADAHDAAEHGASDETLAEGAAELVAEICPPVSRKPHGRGRLTKAEAARHAAGQWKRIASGGSAGSQGVPSGGGRRLASALVVVCRFSHYRSRSAAEATEMLLTLSECQVVSLTAGRSEGASMRRSWPQRAGGGGGAQGESVCQHRSTHCMTTASPQEKLVDTSGAGDAFSSAASWRPFQGQDIASYCKAGAYSASVLI